MATLLVNFPRSSTICRSRRMCSLNLALAFHQHFLQLQASKEEITQPSPAHAAHTVRVSFEPFASALDAVLEGA